MFENEYEPDNFLQKLWDKNHNGGCLCTMRESCGWCSGYKSRQETNKLILQQAKNSGYQIWLNGNSYMQRELRKVDWEYVTESYGLE